MLHNITSGFLDPERKGRWVADAADLEPTRPPIHRYPEDIGSPPHEKQMLFEVKQARHLGRRGTIGEEEGKQGTVAAAVLYMPVDALNTTTNVDWSHEEIGRVGGAMIQAFTEDGTAPTTDNIVEKLTKVGAAGLQVLPADFLAKLATRTLNNVLNPFTGGTSGKAVLESMFGQTIDPRLDMLFQGMQYRRHQFSYTLIPRNQREADSINQILNLFQFYMLPKYGGGDEVSIDSFFIGYPYEFDITMITNMGAASVAEPGMSNPKSPHINKIDRSVLTSCQINHAAGERVAFVGNYYPAATSLTLSFTEVRLQGRDTYGTSMWHGNPETPVDPNNVIGAAAGRALLNKATGNIVNTGDPGNTHHIPGMFDD